MLLVLPNRKRLWDKFRQKERHIQRFRLYEGKEVQSHLFFFVTFCPSASKGSEWVIAADIVRLRVSKKRKKKLQGKQKVIRKKKGSFNVLRKYHKWVARNSRSVCLLVLEARGLTSLKAQGEDILQAVSSACQWPSSPCISSHYSSSLSLYLNFPCL